MNDDMCFKYLYELTNRDWLISSLSGRFYLLGSYHFDYRIKSILLNSGIHYKLENGNVFIEKSSVISKIREDKINNILI